VCWWFHTNSDIGRPADQFKAFLQWDFYLCIAVFEDDLNDPYSIGVGQLRDKINDQICPANSVGRTDQFFTGAFQIGFVRGEGLLFSNHM
jgi:hypothetical protein